MKFKLKVRPCPETPTVEPEFEQEFFLAKDSHGITLKCTTPNGGSPYSVLTIKENGVHLHGFMKSAECGFALVAGGKIKVINP